MSDTEDTLNDGCAYDPEADHALPDEKLSEVLPALLDDEEVTTLLEAQSVNVVTREGYNGYDPKHIEIVLNRALQLYDLLKTGGCEFNDAAEQELDEADEPVIIVLAAQLRDIGHIVHRDNHAYHLILLASDVLDRFLPEFYNLTNAIHIKVEVLHATLCRHREEDPLTLGAGVIRVADALDMERGRSHTPYEGRGHGINTLSSRAIKDVILKPGEESAIPIEIEMLNAAGVYQVDSLPRAKLDGSGLENHVHIIAVNTKSGDRLVEHIGL